MEYTDIKKAIIKSQHCQRNWDLTKEMPKDDIDLLVHAVTNCPSKQNVAYYKVHFITNRDTIETIHDNTRGFAKNYTDTPIVYETNSQTLANLLIVFESCDINDRLHTDKVVRNDEIQAILQNKELTEGQQSSLARDQHMAVGIAAGYVNVVASILGYSTGCCACFDEKAVGDILNTTGKVLLMMGVGFSNSDMNRRIHQKTGFMFPTKPKQPIDVNMIN